MENLKRLIANELREFAVLEETDEHQRKLGLTDCRYIRKSFADRNATYQIIGETKKNFVLQWVLGEDVYPEWGEKVKISKDKILKILQQRDAVQDFIPSRK